MPGKVAVVGSLSQDLVVKAPRRPSKGETLRGSEFGMFAGGKGNNQAMAAARAGADVCMIGRVGSDSFGDMLIATLDKNGVDSRFVLRDPEAGTGIAMITVGGDGDNSIVIVQRANLKLCSDDVDRAAPVLNESKVLLMQLENSIDIVIYAAKVARKAGVLVALNPAPAPDDGQLPQELLANVDILIPNQPEAEQLVGIKVSDEKSAAEAASALCKMGPKCVVITMGELGAFLFEAGGERALVKSFPVTAIDTTAAGDAFCGAFAAAIASGEPMRRAVTFGCAAGALATTKLGAEPSLPQESDIARLAQVAL